MATTVRSVTMPDGNEIEFYAKTYYGVCETPSATQTKTVSIAGFTSASLVAGVRVVIRFVNGDTTHQPKLNVSNTGAKWVDTAATATGEIAYLTSGSWQAGSIVPFVYSGYAWVMERGIKADTTYYGVTKLSNTIANDQTTALTPKAVYDAGYVKASDMSQYVAGVSGIKGNAESTYRTGDVNLTPANIGAVATSGNETVSGNKNFTGDTTLANLALGSETGITSWDGFVKTSGNQSVAGNKNFTGSTTIASLTLGTESAITGWDAIQYTWFGTCDTAASTSEKAVTCSGFTLAAGRLVAVQFSTANTVEGTITLNVNSTGAKPIIIWNAQTSASNTLYWYAGEVLTFIYNGTNYRLIARNAPTVSNKTITWSVPTVDSSSCSILVGGYIQEGHHVYVHCAIQPTATLSANTGKTFLTGFPASYNSMMPISCICNYNIGGAYIDTTGKLTVISSTQITNSQKIWIAGTYLASTWV